MMRARVCAGVAVALLGLLPAGVSAQSDPTAGDVTLGDAAVAAGPTLDCNAVALRLMAAEVSGARVACHVSGVATGDSTFTVSAVRPAGMDARPICVANLSDG